MSSNEQVESIGSDLTRLASELQSLPVPAQGAIADMMADYSAISYANTAALQLLSNLVAIGSNIGEDKRLRCHAPETTSNGR